MCNRHTYVSVQIRYFHSEKEAASLFSEIEATWSLPPIFTSALNYTCNISNTRIDVNNFLWRHFRAQNRYANFFLLLVNNSRSFGIIWADLLSHH